MPDTPLAADAANASIPSASVRLRHMPRGTYGFRILGMGLASLPLVAVMREIDAPWPAWAWMVFTCFLWPHLAYLWAVRHPDPFRAEIRNFLVDSVFAGSWVPMLHFNLLPSAVLMNVVTADKINTGVRGLWFKSLPGAVIAMVAVGLLTGFQTHFATSTTVLLACLPIMVIHTMAVSLSSYRLLRQVQRQNAQLEHVNRVDSLTGLDSRSHWQAQADALLRRHREQQQPATLMVLDIDRFKAINDRYGHGAGDEVLVQLSRLIRQELRADCHAGRLGGDEFAVAMPAGLPEAAAVAERLRQAVASLSFRRLPDVRVSISLGLAAPGPAPADLGEWLEAADRALYRAKQAGRNRVEEALLAASPG